MMHALTKRIIPCLDIREGRTVKGLRFEHLQDVGDPVALAADYARQGADELVLLDINATHERRSTMLETVQAVARAVNIPFTVGGGVSSEEDVYRLLRSGADKIAVNSAAVREPSLVSRLAARFGTQCVVVAIDARLRDEEWYVYLSGGREATGIRVVDWAEQAAAAGAGELLLTSMDHDGVQAGFACDLLSAVNSRVRVPVIASGGAGNCTHFEAVLREGGADAALAAGIFHRGELSIPVLKQYLRSKNIPVR